MFLRRTRYRMADGADPQAAQAAFEAEMRARIRPQDIDGLISTAHVPDDEGGWMVVAVWSDKSSAMDATPRIRAVWADMQDQLSAPPEIEAAGVTLNEVL